MDVLALLAAVYVAIAIVAVLETLAGGVNSPKAGLRGTLTGCFLCLFWLPMFVVFAVMQAMRDDTATSDR